MGVEDEGRMEDAKRKYPYSAQYLDFFKDVPNKYILWIAQQIQKDQYQESDLKEFKDTVMKFDALVNSNKITKLIV